MKKTRIFWFIEIVIGPEIQRAASASKGEAKYVAVSEAMKEIRFV
jgi:hypothetical protein